MKGMKRYHALSFCPKASAGKERAHPHQTCGLLGVCFMPSQKGAIRPFFLVAGLYFSEGRWLNMPWIVTYCGSNEGKEDNR